MKLVYTHENRLLVGNAQNILEMNGFQVVLKNEHISSVMGETSVFDAWPELWVVRDRDYSRACALLEQSLAEVAERDDWRCKQCGENNDASFDICWQCQV